MPSVVKPIPPFAQSCIDHAADAWGASFDHPFVRALVDGSLDAERFRFYQMQDARYLEAIADAFARIATRCSDPDRALFFMEAAQNALRTERSLHLGYGEQLDYGPDDIAALELTPNNRAYQNHMLERVQRGTLAEAIAAVTPCPWLYRELGQHILDEMGTVPDDHPYATWIRRYATPDPEKTIDIGQLLRVLQDAADGTTVAAQERAREAFRVSTRYEWMFWQQAWTQQSWPV